MFTHRSFYKDRKKIPTPAGSRFKPEYSARYDDKGVLVLDEVGTVDVYSDIQSYHDSVEIHNIMRRYLNGETDVLERVQGFYADASDLPDSYVGFLNKFQESQEFFAQLPPEIREIYNNDFAQFIADFDSRVLYGSVVPASSDIPLEPEPEPEPIKTTRKKSAKVVDDEE